MATLNVIRRWALREQMSIREISRRTGLARNTVKKYLRSDETEPTYARRVSPSKLDPYAEKLATWLGIEATKSRKQRRNLKQIYTLLWPCSNKDSILGGECIAGIPYAEVVKAVSPATSTNHAVSRSRP